MVVRDLSAQKVTSQGNTIFDPENIQISFGDVILLKDGAVKVNNCGLDRHMWAVIDVDKDRVRCFPISSQAEKIKRFPGEYYEIPNWEQLGFKKPSFVKVNRYAWIPIEDIRAVTSIELTTRNCKDILVAENDSPRHELIEDLLLDFIF